MIWLSQIPHISNTNQKKIETQLCLHSRVLYYRFYLTLFASVGEVLKIHICGIYHFVLVIPFRKTHWKELHTDIFFLMHIYMFLWDIVIFQMSKIQLAYSLVEFQVYTAQSVCVKGNKLDRRLLFTSLFAFWTVYWKTEILLNGCLCQTEHLIIQYCWQCSHIAKILLRWKNFVLRTSLFAHLVFHITVIDTYRKKGKKVR